MIQTNIQKLFEYAGIDNPRPTDKALEEMGISRRRFTQLLENTHKSPITVAELSAIKGWINQIKEIDPEQVVGEYEPAANLAESLGMSKC
jgi:hypothetical protein